MTSVTFEGRNAASALYTGIAASPENGGENHGKSAAKITVKVRASEYTQMYFLLFRCRYPRQPKQKKQRQLTE
jgi:hypothetical protein